MNIVIFGITGDVATKKILPAIENLRLTNKLFKDANVIGFARSEKENVTVVGNYNSSHDVEKLKEFITEGEKTFFYFAVPPSVYEDLLLSLYRSGLFKKGEKNKKILIEKPFGLDKQSAKRLFNIIDEHFDSNQVYPLDHYAGKKEVREFKSHPKGISKLEVSIFEKNDVANRAGYYDTVGAINDVGQNHLLYMLAVGLNKNDRAHIVKKLEIEKGTLVVGQYEGYLDEKGVEKDSKTETFFRVKARVDIVGFEDTEVVISGGKALGTSGSFINKTELSSGTHAYENVLLDAVNNRREYFLSEKEIMACWDFAENLKLEARKVPLMIYKKGSLPEDIGVV